MAYIIDDKISYDSGTGILRIFKEEQSFVQLSNQASRLLHALLKTPGIILSRDYLIKHVWEEHGYSGSSISLNVAISEVRKAVKELGHTPGIIQTIRNKGIIFSANIEQQADDSNTIQPTLVKVEKEHKPNISRLLSLKGKTFKELTWPLLVSLVIVSSLILVHIFPKEPEVNTNFDEKPITLGTYKKCSLFWIATPGSQKDTPLKQDIQNEIERRKIGCQNTESDIYFSSITRSQTKNTFISACTNSKKTLNRSCHTYQIISED